MLPSFRQYEKYLIIGDYRTGKTTWAKWLLAQFPRFWVWDPTWAFPGGTANLQEAKARFLQHGRAIFQPGAGGGKGALDVVYAEFCRFALSQSNMLVFIDEPALVMTPTQYPVEFSELHRLGHKRGVGVALATHRFHGDIPPICRIAHHYVIFRISVDIDVQAVGGLVGHAAMQHIPRLPDYHWWLKSGSFNGPVAPVTVITREPGAFNPPADSFRPSENQSHTV